VGEATKDYLKRYEALHSIGPDDKINTTKDWKNTQVGGGACSMDMPTEMQQHQFAF
jgi:hypothetical protein